LSLLVGFPTGGVGLEEETRGQASKKPSQWREKGVKNALYPGRICADRNLRTFAATEWEQPRIGTPAGDMMQVG
jgi:hypothetical protein